MLTKHTPLPWDYFTGRTRHHVEVAYGAPGMGTAICSVPKSQEANAEFIVRACNAHYDLLAALEALYDRRTSDTMAKARDAIAKARGT